MKLIGTTKDNLLFHLGKRERHLLLEVLKLYPRIPPAHQPLSKSGRLPDEDSSRRLLEEALADQRAENKKLLQAWLGDPKRFADSDSGCRLSLCPSDLEWLLQVLNDIRVGSWVLLGSPDPKLEAEQLNKKTEPDLWAMEVSGYFQMELLGAVEGGREV